MSIIEIARFDVASVLVPWASACVIGIIAGRATIKVPYAELASYCAFVGFMIVVAGAVIMMFIIAIRFAFGS